MGSLLISGIGFFTALDFARRNARVILVCRNQRRGQLAVEKIKLATGNQNVVLYLCDLSLMKSVRDVAEMVLKNETRLNILVNNAAITSTQKTITEEGKEMIYATNHFGPFLLTHLLLDLLKQSAPSRVVNVSSEGHAFHKPDLGDIKGEQKYDGFHRYCHTKLFNVLFTRKLAQRLVGTGVTTYSLEPGLVATDIWNNLGWPSGVIAQFIVRNLKSIMKTSEEGAQTTIHCAVSENIENLSGRYFDECKEAEHKSSKASKDMGLANKLWDISEKETGLVGSTINMIYTALSIVGLCFVVAFILFRIYVRLTSGRCTSKADLTGKTTMVTGANSGIGYYTALDFARRNARVILVCRSQQRGQLAKEKITQATGNQNVVLYMCDLSLMKSVRDVAEMILKNESRLDILVNNAGRSSITKTITEEGKEMIYATNHFGPFLLTHLLLDLLKKSALSRIVNVSSVLHQWYKPDLEDLTAEKNFIGTHRYCHTKLFNVLFTRELANRLQGTGVTAYSLHPGLVATDIWKYGGRGNGILKAIIRVVMCTMKTSEEGAQTTIHCAVSENIEDFSGNYFVDCKKAEHKSSKASKDLGLAKKVWEISERETGLIEH